MRLPRKHLLRPQPARGDPILLHLLPARVPLELRAKHRVREPQRVALPGREGEVPGVKVQRAPRHGEGVERHDERVAVGFEGALQEGSGQGVGARAVELEPARGGRVGVLGDEVVGDGGVGGFYDGLERGAGGRAVDEGHAEGGAGRRGAGFGVGVVDGLDADRGHEDWGFCDGRC